MQTILQNIPSAWWDGGWDQKVALQEFINQHPAELENCAKAQFYLAANYYAEKDYKKAVDEFKKVPLNYPSAAYSLQAQYELGQLYLNALEDPATAITYYNKVIETSPKTVIAAISQVMVGRANMRAGNLEAAKAAWQKVVDLYASAVRQKVEALIGLGDLGIAQGDADQSLRYYKQAFLTAPANEQALFQQIIDKIYNAFKYKDLAVTRANLFIKFQRYGANGEDGLSGTKDDLLNPLAEY